MQLVSIDLDSATSTRMNAKNLICEKSSNAFENADLDRALTLTKYGRFHYKVVASCAFCLISSGLQNSLSAYVLPAASCELHLQSTEIGFINAAFLVGGTCSSFLWGVIADLTGRKKVLVSTLILDAFVTLTCILMQDFTGLLVCRFINGFLIGGPGSLIFTYLAEFHAPHHRSKSIYYSGIFFSIAWLILPAIARLILPLQIDIVLNGFIICSSWRIFLALLAIPDLIAGIWIFYLPESPKFLATGDPKKALIVLKQMYALNTGKDESEFPVKSLKSDVQILNGTTGGVNCRGKAARIIEDVYSQMYTLVRAPLLCLTIITSGIMFSNMFGYFGLGLWLPELIARFQEFQEEYPNASIRLHQLTNLTRTKTSGDSCIPEFNNDFFQSAAAMGVSTIIGNVLSGWFAGKFEHKVIPLFSMFCGAISAGSIYWTRSPLQNLIAACVFQATMTTANMAIGCLIVELFPTNVNAIAICTAMFIGRIGAICSNLTFGYLMDFNCEVAIFLVSGVLFLGTLLCLKVPNSGHKCSSGDDELENKNNVEVSVISVTSL